MTMENSRLNPIPLTESLHHFRATGRISRRKRRWDMAGLGIRTKTVYTRLSALWEQVLQTRPLVAQD